jgi:hypothetical protein
MLARELLDGMELIRIMMASWQRLDTYGCGDDMVGGREGTPGNLGPWYE